MLKRTWREKHQQIKEWKRKKVAKKEAKEMLKREEEEKEKETLSNEGQTNAGREWTASIALPASIVENAQTLELKTYLCGQIARAAAIFNIDEIVVYDEYSSPSTLSDEIDDNLSHDKRKQAMAQMVRILQYLECPQYLRKYLFPLQRHLQFAGLLNPLDCKHHLKTEDVCDYREGVVTNRPVKDGKGSYVFVGLKNDVQIDKCLKPNVRVTVKFHANEDFNKKKLKGVAVAPSAPRTQQGLYWGYSIRIAKSLSAVFTESPFDGGYDLTIGTSERGDDVDKTIKKIPKRFSHLLIVFGGLKGIEAALDSDESLAKVEDAKDLFNFYLNTCPQQGSNTIRTEEAILITLSSLRRRLLKIRTRFSPDKINDE